MKYLNETGLAYLWNNKLKPKFTELTNKTDQLSNPNLLYNADFQVWQEGESFNKSSYTAEGWIAHFANASVSKSDKGIYINAVGSDVTLIQYIEKNLTSETLTMSFEYEDNGLNKKIVHTFYNVSSSKETISLGDGVSISLFYDSNKKATTYWMNFNNKNIHLKYCKLEFGEIATPFVPRSYAEELEICQRYFLKLTSESIYSNSGLYSVFRYPLSRFNNEVGICYITLPVDMRLIPTVYTKNMIMGVPVSGWPSGNVELLAVSKKQIEITITINNITNDNSHFYALSQYADSGIYCDARIY